MKNIMRAKKRKKKKKEKREKPGKMKCTTRLRTH